MRDVWDQVACHVLGSMSERMKLDLQTAVVEMKGQIQTLDDPPALSDLVVYIDTFIESIASSRSSDMCDGVVASL